MNSTGTGAHRMLLNTGRPLWRAAYLAPVKSPRPIIDYLYENFAAAVKEPGAAQHARAGHF